MFAVKMVEGPGILSSGGSYAAVNFRSAPDSIGSSTFVISTLETRESEKNFASEAYPAASAWDRNASADEPLKTLYCGHSGIGGVGYLEKSATGLS